MKYAIICKKKGALDWVCAISDSYKSILKYTSKLDKSIKSSIVKIKTKKYPIFIIEDNNKFEFVLSEKNIQKKAKAVKIKKNFEECYFRVYTINRGFFMRPIGTDSMGRLNIMWVTNWILEHVYKCVYKPKKK